VPLLHNVRKLNSISHPVLLRLVFNIIYPPTGCGYEVSGMIFLKASYPYTYRLLTGVTFRVLLWNNYAFRPTMLPLLETLSELLLWNSFQCRRYIFGISSVSCTLTPFKADFLETARSHSNPQQRKRVGVPFQ
jgi:hypothetical protein